MDPALKYKRVLLKLSGEALAGHHKASNTPAYGLDASTLTRIATSIKTTMQTGVQMGIVVGGGNIFRGLSEAAKDMDRSSSDYMGMLATCINSLALQDALEKQGLQTRVQTALEIVQVAEPYIRRRAMRHLEMGRIVIFGAGTGNPYFTTDTAAALRAMEIQADVLLKATKVDGMYDQDPRDHADAKLLNHISYMDVLKQGLHLMDSTATTMCMDNKLPIVAFNIRQPDNILKIIQGEKIGTLIS